MHSAMFKITFSSFVLISCFLGSGILTTFPNALADRESATQLEMGVSAERFYYREEGGENFRSIENGALPRIDLRVERELSAANLFFLGHFMFGAGQVSYDGGTTQFNDDGTTTTRPAAMKTPMYIMGFNGAFGYNFLSKSSPGVLMPFIGAGMHTWYRGHDGSLDGAYTEIYRWINLPIGLKTSYQATDSFSLGITAAFKPTLGGRMTAYFSEISSKLADINVSLGADIGYELRAPLRIRISKDSELSFSPLVSYFGFRAGSITAMRTSSGAKVVDSNDNVIYVQEPSSRTFEAGATLGYELEL